MPKQNWIHLMHRCIGSFIVIGAVMMIIALFWVDTTAFESELSTLRTILIYTALPFFTLSRYDRPEWVEEDK